MRPTGSRVSEPTVSCSGASIRRINVTLPEYKGKMGEVRYKRHWSRKVSTGKKGAPEELSNFSDVLKRVSNTPLSIAYIDKNMVNDSVKVLMTVYVFEDI